MSFFTELKRRNVFRVAIAYVATAWLLAQVADLVFDNFGTPEWVGKTVLFLLALGLPVAILLAWAYELTPEGIKREGDVDRSESITPATGRKLNLVIIAVLVAAVGLLLFDKFMLRQSAAPQAVPTETVSDAPAAPAAVGKPVIAVLPFESRSADESDAYFVDGMHDDLLTQLARVGSWKVISRTSVERFRDTRESMRRIGEHLGASSIIEGAVQRAGDRVRINVQLIDAATDQHLWAESYDRRLTAGNIFEIQTEIARSVATKLQAALSPKDAARIASAGTQSLEAYEAYLLGRERWRERTAESVEEAVRLFQRAIHLDPGYALAYVGLGDAYRFQVPFGGRSGEEMFPKAQRAIETALELDDRLGEAHAALGGLRRQMHDLDGAILALERALELNPNFAIAYMWYAICLGELGRVEEAERVYSQGLELDPLSVVMRNNRAWNLDALGRFEDMRAELERIIEIDPDFWMGYASMGGYQVFVRGRLDEALPWSTRALAANPSDPELIALIAIQYLQLGDFEGAERWTQRVARVQPEPPGVAFVNYLAATYRNKETDPGRLPDLRRSNSPEEFILARLRDQDLTGRRPERAYQRYFEIYPEILGENGPEVHQFNALAATDIAYLLRESGEPERAERLLDEISRVNESIPLLGAAGSFFGNAAVFAMRNSKQEALAELRRGVDAGWRALWRYFFDHYTVFESLRGEPEFQALRAEVAADIEKQLARVRELEAAGEIPSPEDF